MSLHQDKNMVVKQAANGIVFTWWQTCEVH